MKTAASSAFPRPGCGKATSTTSSSLAKRRTTAWNERSSHRKRPPCGAVAAASNRENGLAQAVVARARVGRAYFLAFDRRLYGRKNREDHYPHPPLDLLRSLTGDDRVPALPDPKERPFRRVLCLEPSDPAGPSRGTPALPPRLGILGHRARGRLCRAR